MRIILLLLSIFPFIAFPDQSSNQLNISSEKIGYDGKTLNMDGTISLSHPLGTLTSSKASLIKDGEHKNNKIFDSILLEKKVKLELARGGILSGEKATYDMDNQTIEFIKVKHKIKYVDKLKKKDGRELLFSVQSDKAFSNPISSEKIDEVPFNFIDKVKINIDNKIAIYGNEAICTNDRICIYPKNERSFCKAIYSNLAGQKPTSTEKAHSTEPFLNLKILSKFIEFNLSDAQLFLEKPHGKISDSIKFSSDKLFFNKDENKLTLDQHTVIKDDKSSFICSSLDIYLNDNKPQKAISSNDAKISLNNEKHSKITSTSPIIFDFENKTASSEALTESSCLCYEDDDLVIFSKKANLNLSESKDLFKITGAVLENEVVFISKSMKDNSLYGIADKLTYDSETKLITLESMPGKKVIFVKNDGNLKLSADKIEIYHTKNIDEDKIKALGTVRFKLTLDEQSKLMESITNYKDKYDTKKSPFRS